jgi:hypothetical protein
MVVMVGVIVAVSGTVMVMVMIVAMGVSMIVAAGATGRGDIEHVVGMLVMMVVMTTAAIGAVRMRRMFMGLVFMGLVFMGRVLMGVVLMGLVLMGRMLMGRMVMAMMVMAMCVFRVIVPRVIVPGMVIGAALGLEGTHHLCDRAALAADHLGQNVVMFDVERVSGDLGRRMSVADMPGQPHQPQRVLGAHLKQFLLRCADRDQPAILELQAIALAENAGLVEIEQHVEAADGAQHCAAALAALMVKDHGVGNLVGPDGRLADDGSGAEHGVVLCSCCVNM